MKNLEIKEDLKDVQGCVYRIWYNSHYIVVMGKTFARSLTSIQNDIDRFSKGVRDGYSQTNIYLNFYYHILINPDKEYSIEIIIKTDSPYQLLKHCQIELANGMSDERCLNSKHTPYINKSLQSNKTETKDGKPLRKGQVNRGTVLNFLRWKKKTYPNIL